MRIKRVWDKTISLNELILNAHPENKTKVDMLLTKLEQKKHIALINPTNNRTVKVDIDSILTIESYTQLSIVKLSNDKQEYYIQKRLKDLDQLNQYGLFRINNSMMINISKIKSFQAVENARLEMITQDNQIYTVSRYYAKKIKEELSCSNI